MGKQLVEGSLGWRPPPSKDVSLGKGFLPTSSPSHKPWLLPCVLSLLLQRANPITSAGAHRQLSAVLCPRLSPFQSQPSKPGYSLGHRHHLFMCHTFDVSCSQPYKTWPQFWAGSVLAELGSCSSPWLLHPYQLSHIKVIVWHQFSWFFLLDIFFFFFSKINMHYAIQKKTYYPGGLLQSSRVHLKIQQIIC